MPFTKREQRRGEWTAWGMRAAMAVLIIGILGFASGCGEGAKDLTLHDAQLFLENGNAQGEMSLRLTGSPLSYNMTHSLGPTVTLEFDGSIDFGTDDE